MLIHLIRHTTPLIDDGICYGQTDLDVTDSLEAERDIILSKLKSNYDAVFTSPLIRCARLAESIQAPKRFSDKRLMEYHFGDWELKPWNSFKTEDQRTWMNNFVEQAAPNGESLITMRDRVLDFWLELEKTNYKNVAVVTHSGVQRLIHAYVLDTPMNKIFSLSLVFGAVMELNSSLNDELLTIRHL